MKRLVIVTLVLMTCSLSQAITCPAGEHVQCTSGSGRGGGYHQSCTCAPDMCNFGFQWVPVGGTIYSYTTSSTVYPDVCSNYLLASQCVSAGTLVPEPQNAVCNDGAMPCGGDDCGID